MMQDPLAFFYEVVCVGLEWDDIANFNEDDLFPTSPVLMKSGQCVYVILCLESLDRHAWWSTFGDFHIHIETVYV